MAKSNCPFCNSRNTFNIAYEKMSEEKRLRNYIGQEEIGLKIEHRIGYDKYDFDGEKMISHLPNRYCKDCCKTFQSRKVLYAVDISKITFTMFINNNYYKLVIDYSDNSNISYCFKKNWIKMNDEQVLDKNKANLILANFKKYKPNVWRGYFGRKDHYSNYYWKLKCTYYNGVDYLRMGNDEVPDIWNEFVEPFEQITKEKFLSLVNV